MTVKLSIPASLLIAGSVGRQTIGSLGSSEDSTTGSLKKPTFSERHPKAVRSVTVIGYLFCVSLAAILLSAYYVVFWKPSTKDAQKEAVNSRNTTSLPCRYFPTENGVGTQYIPQYQRLHPSRYKHSGFHVVYRGPAGAPQSLPPLIPQPSKLVSHPNTFESVQHEHSSNNSLQENNSASSDVESAHYENDDDTSTTGTTVKSTFSEEYEGKPTSESEQDVADSTFVPNPSSPSLDSIILQKLLRYNKSVIHQQQTYKESEN